MPVRIGGEVLNTQKFVAWLKQSGISRSPEEDWPLAFFLQHCNAQYESHQQSKFVQDFGAMTGIWVNGYVISPEVKWVREGYQTWILQSTLVENAKAAANGAVKIKFIKEQVNIANVFGVPEKHVAVSKYGRLNLYMGGFAGCVGVLLTPTGPLKGCVLAHIAQDGKKGEWGEISQVEYMMQTINGVIDVARRYWANDTIDMTLVVGEPNKHGLELWDLSDTVKKQCANRGLGNVYDLRDCYELAHDFVFDSNRKEFWLLKVRPHRDSSIENAEFMEEKMKSVKPEQLDLTYSAKGLKLWVFN
jgi:hypothetical protein